MRSLEAFSSLTGRIGLWDRSRERLEPGCAVGSERMLIILNLGATPVAFVSTPPKGIVLVSTSGEREGELIDLNVQLGANEGLIIKLAPEVDLSSIEPGFQNPMSPPVIHANNP